MNNKQKKILELVVNELFEINKITPEYIGSYPHISYLPNEIENYYFYFWENSSNNEMCFSINKPKLTKIIKEKGKILNINVSRNLVSLLINQLTPIVQKTLLNVINFLNENQKNELNYFKHWISRCLLQYWEIKNIDKYYKGKNHLIIYDKNNNKKLDLEINSKNHKLPFGSFNYNDEFFEKNVFCKIESDMGQILNNLNKDQQIYFSAKEEITICYFWLILIIRNKHTILHFSEAIKNEINEIIIKNKNFKELAIKYYKHDISDNIDKYMSELKIFQKEQELNNFLNGKNYYYFAKNIYWKYISPLLLNNEDIYNTNHHVGSSILKDIIFNITKNYQIKRILTKEYIVNLSDYPCLSFKIEEKEIKPINIDVSFFNNYIEEGRQEIKNQIFKSSTKLDENLQIIEQVANLEKISQFDLLLIPVNPKNIIIIIKNELEKSLEEVINEFFIKNKLSEETINDLKDCSESGKMLYFYSVMTHIISKDFIIFPSENHIENTKEFIEKENLFIENVTNLIEKNKKSYFNKENIKSYKKDKYTYIQSSFCNYRIKT